MSVERPSLRLGRESFFAGLAGTSLALLLLTRTSAGVGTVLFALETDEEGVLVRDLRHAR